MASANKPTAVHFTLIGCVMWALIATVVAYMFWGDYTEANNKAITADSNLAKEKSARRTMDEEIQELKKSIGIQVESVGLDRRDDPTTVLGGMRQALTSNAGPLMQPTVVDTLKKMREEMDNLTRERNTLLADLSDHKTRLLAIQGNSDTRVAQFENQSRKAETDLQNQITSSEEAIGSKQKEIDTLRSEMAQLNVELQSTKDLLARVTEDKNKQINNLERINVVLQEKFEANMNVSFEQPDGELRWVDHKNGTVWVNLGKADNLQRGTTFSVYTKGYGDVGRGSADIKGAIEVTNVVGAHLAEAKITDEDLTQPMSAGDPVYTPLWSPGRAEQFAIVGFIDLDKDKQSDRPLLHELVASSGAKITAEVNDQGERTGEPIDVNTKYLVVADLPDPAQVPPGKERETADKILEEYKRLESEARQHAVRKISLSDFLSHIGYKPTQRNWRPGQQVPWLLRSGAQSSGVNERAGNVEASGNVSGAFRTNRRIGTQGSGNQFRSGGSSR